MFKSIKKQLDKVKFSQTTIQNLNTKCNVTNLTNYFRIGVSRAFLQASITFFIAYFATIGYLYNNVDGEELFLIRSLIVTYFTILVICTLYCVCFTLYISNKIEYILTSKKFTKKSYAKRYKYFNKTILKKIKKWYVAGTLFYGIVPLLIYPFIFLISNESRNHSIGMIFALSLCIGVAGATVGAFWCICNYYADNNVDWGYIIKDLPVISKSQNNLSAEEMEQIIKIRGNKFKSYKKHSIFLGAVSVLIITIAMYFFFRSSSDLDLGIGFYNNVHILFFIGVCFSFYKYCYSHYYKREKSNKKIYPHLSDFNNENLELEETENPQAE